ncbi:hypothetical protein ALC56_09303 [Trachymyrmex septentrionalis]|uniref:Uncharacterized protein n=1 Tax=Trachymyrmex septentrionalis TaxID=34720 RepID=A0A195F7C5_9HYME|nr:hypothetical protein ALC56_09303 [Trachymyrmex septentrionalis]
MVSIRLILTIAVIMVAFVISANAAYKKPPFNGSIFGKRSNTVTAFLVGAVMLLICENTTIAEEVPAFFLKIAKIPTLPRVGRSGRFEDFFYKAEKHIPRIGRSNQHKQSTNPLLLQDEQETYSDLTKRRIDYPSKVEEWSWQNFPLAIEGPKELWRALAGYSRDGSDE